MDIRNPNWKHRYDGAGVRLHPSVERFGYKELEILDKSYLDQFAQKHPKLERTIQDVRARVVDPVADMLSWDYNLEVAELALADNLRLQNYAESLKKRYGVSDKLDSPVVKEHSSITNEMQTNLNKIKENLPNYKHFLENLMRTIIGFSNSLQSSDYSILDNREVRDRIFRKVLPREETWLLGWGSYFLIRSIIPVQKIFELRKAIYDEFKEEHGGVVPYSDLQLKALVSGPRIQTPTIRSVFEDLAADVPTYEELSEFYGILKIYFNKRAEQIIKKC